MWAFSAFHCLVNCERTHRMVISVHTCHSCIIATRRLVLWDLPVAHNELLTFESYVMKQHFMQQCTQSSLLVLLFCVFFCVSELSLRAITLNILWLSSPYVMSDQSGKLSNSLKILWAVTGESSFVSVASKLNNSLPFICYQFIFLQDSAWMSSHNAKLDIPV